MQAVLLIDICVQRRCDSLSLLGVEGSIPLEVLGIWGATEFAVLVSREQMDDFFLGPRNMGYEHTRTRRVLMGNGMVAMYERKPGRNL